MYEFFHRRCKSFRIVLLALVGLLVTCLPGFYGHASAASAGVQEKLDKLNKMSGQDRQRFLEGKAAKEGKIVMYTSASPDNITDWNALFKKKYPQIDAQFVRMTTRNVLEKAVRESEVGRPVASILNLPAAQLAILINKGMIARYVTPESKDFDPEFKDRNGLWTLFFYNPEVVAFNKDRIKKEDVPATLEALHNSALRGKMGRTRMGNRWVAAVFKVKGKSQGMELIKKIAAQNPRIFRSNTALVNAVSSGQVAIAFDLHMSQVAKLLKRGAPIGYVVPQPLFVHSSYLALPKDAPHPHAAALAYDWLLSKNGAQSMYKEQFQMGPRKDTEYAYKDIIRAAKVIVPYSPNLLSVDKLGGYSKTFEDLFIRK